jgi:predicted nucleic acid-binding protein
MKLHPVVTIFPGNLGYIYSDDELHKSSLAKEAVTGKTCMTSVQVLLEFSSVCLRKMHMPVNDVLNAIDEIAAFAKVCPIDENTIRKALILSDRFDYSYYDSAILASALQNGCGVVYSEDMQDGQIIDGRLTIKNIFKG